MWYNKYRKGTGLNLDCGNLVKSIRNEISTRDMPWALPIPFKKIFSKNFEKPLDKLARMWYNKYRKGKENPKNQKGKDYDKHNV